MTFPNESSPDETRIAQRELYRAGQTRPASKTPPSKKSDKPSFWERLWGKSSSSSAKPSAPRPSASRATASKPDDKPSRWKRLRKALLLALIYFGMGTISYSLFVPDPVEEIKEARQAMRNLSSQERREKSKEVRTLMKNLTPKQLSDLEKERRDKGLDKTRTFFKQSKEEQIAQIRKEVLQQEQQRQRRAAQRNANAGRNGAGGRGGGRGAAGQAAGRNGAAGLGAGGRAGGGPGGGAGMGRGGGGGGLGGGFGGGGGGGGPGGGRGGGGDRNARQKNRLDQMSPEDRAQNSLYRGMVQQVRQGMGLPSGGPGGGRGGGRR